jgi:hypothetical protein
MKAFPDKQDLFACTVSLAALSPGVLTAQGAQVPVMIRAVEALSAVGDYEAFFATLTSNSHWDGLLKATVSTFYSTLKSCFMGMQAAMQATSGKAGQMVGEWLAGALSVRGELREPKHDK